MKHISKQYIIYITGGGHYEMLLVKYFISVHFYQNEAS